MQAEVFKSTSMSSGHAIVLFWLHVMLFDIVISKGKKMFSKLDNVFKSVMA